MTADSIVYSSEWFTYSYFESRSRSKFDRRCIDGRICGRTKCVGYCRNDAHPGFLTGKLKKQHDCIGKACLYYVDRMS